MAREFKAGAANETVPVGQCPADAMILDAGPKTVAELSKVFAGCKTLIWNGPLGAFEIEPFNAATFAAARVATRLTREGKLVSVAGGGDTVAALNQAGAAGFHLYLNRRAARFWSGWKARNCRGCCTRLKF